MKKYNLVKKNLSFIFILPDFIRHLPVSMMGRRIPGCGACLWCAWCACVWCVCVCLKCNFCEHFKCAQSAVPSLKRSNQHIVIRIIWIFLKLTCLTGMHLPGLTLVCCCMYVYTYIYIYMFAYSYVPVRVCAHACAAQTRTHQCFVVLNLMVVISASISFLHPVIRV